MAKTKYSLRSEANGYPIEDVRFLDEAAGNFPVVAATQANWQLLRNGKPLAKVELASTPEDALDHVREMKEKIYSEDEDSAFGMVAAAVVYSHMAYWEQSPEFVEKNDVLVRETNQLIEHFAFGAAHAEMMSMQELAEQNSSTMLGSDRTDFVQTLDKDLDKQYNIRYNPYYSRSQGRVMAPKAYNIVN